MMAIFHQDEALLLAAAYGLGRKKRVHFLFQQKLASSSSYCQETKGSAAAAALCSEEDFINQASFEAPLRSKKRCYAQVNLGPLFPHSNCRLLLYCFFFLVIQS